jgi:DNA-directed RNA polymerase specialized sigma24 family protein
MSARRIRERVKKLEVALPSPPAKEDKLIGFLRNLRILAVAYYLGDPQPNEAIIQAYERALGVEELASLLNTSPETVMQRDALAFDRLLEKFGVSRTDDWDKLVYALVRMADGFCEHYRETLEGYAHQYGVELPLRA